MDVIQWPLCKINAAVVWSRAASLSHIRVDVIRNPGLHGRNHQYDKIAFRLNTIGFYFTTK